MSLTDHQGRGGLRLLVSATMALEEIGDRYTVFLDTHLARGCGGDAVTVLTTERGNRFLIGDCPCQCDDHPCKARDTEPPCSCAGAGYVRSSVPRGQPGFGKAIPCPECNTPGSERNVAYLWARSGLSEPQRRFTLESMDRGFPRAPIEGWVREAHRKRPFLVLSGRRGTGKTHGAIGAVQAFIAAGTPARYTTATAFLEAIKATYAPDSVAKEAHVLTEFKQAPVLAIDDLDAEQETEWSRARLFDLIDHRWENQRITIITTNVTKWDLPDSRTWSRVFGDRFALVMTMTGRDRRFLEGDDAGHQS